MQNSDLAFCGPEQFRPQQPTSRTMGKLPWLIGGSIAVHIAILATLSFPEPVKSEKSKPINAVLYFPPKPPPVTAVEQQPVQIEQAETDEPELTDTRPIEPLKDAANVRPEAPAKEAETEINQEQVSSVNSPPKGEILTQADDSPAPAVRSIAKSVTSAIASQQQQMVDTLAEQASRERRQAHISPDLHIGEYVPPKEVVGEYKINCDKGINLAFAVLAGVTGGNVQCSKRNEFQQFIDKRQHKQTEQ